MIVVGSGDSKHGEQEQPSALGAGGTLKLAYSCPRATARSHTAAEQSTCAGSSTPMQNLDPFNPILQQFRDRFEQKVFPDEGIEASDSEVVRLYNRAYKLPYVRLLVCDVLSGRWNLGTTQEEVAERIGIERTRLSDALRRGELSLDAFMRLRSCPTKPVDWEPPLESLLSEMDRSGFIAVAQYFASLVPDRAGLVPESMTELDYELMCEVFRRYVSWTFAVLSKNNAVASDIVTTVVRDQQRNVFPGWYTLSERKMAQAKIDRLMQDSSFAFEHIASLSSNWQDIFVVTWCQLELVRWSTE